MDEPRLAPAIAAATLLCSRSPSLCTIPALRSKYKIALWHILFLGGAVVGAPNSHDGPSPSDWALWAAHGVREPNLAPKRPGVAAMKPLR